MKKIIVLSLSLIFIFSSNGFAARNYDNGRDQRNRSHYSERDHRDRSHYHRPVIKERRHPRRVVYSNDRYYRNSHYSVSTGDAVIGGAVAGLVGGLVLGGINWLTSSQNTPKQQPVVTQQEYDYQMQVYNQCLEVQVYDLQRRKQPRECYDLHPDNFFQRR